MRHNIRQRCFAYPRKKRLNQKTFRLTAIALLATISLLAVISPSLRAGSVSDSQNNSFAQIEKKWHSRSDI